MTPIDVATYYRHTRFDYRLVWNSRENLAVHFGYYDEQASVHDSALNNLNRVMAELADVQSGERVLDAGCGMGSACFWLAENRGAQATGISLVAEQVADCEKFRRKKEVKNVAFLQADYCHTPFPDEHFDVVWACESLCHAAQKADFYREAWRLLRPGGRLVIAEYMRTERPVSAPGEALLAAWLRPWAIPDLDTAEEHVQHAIRAGFQAPEVRDVTPQMRPSLRNLHRLCRQWLPFGRMLRALRLVSAVRLGNVRASIKQYEALQEGAWRYVLLLAVKP